LHDLGIKIAKSVIIRPNDIVDPALLVNMLGLPMFIKPNAGGSSFGTTKVKELIEILPAIDRARRESQEVIAESFIKGREITVGVIKHRGRTIALTPCEVRSKNEFFDYEAKYNPELNEEIIPAPIPGKLLEQAQNLAVKIYNHLNCKGIVRIDFILSEPENEFYFLELNSIPGMTSASIVPKMIKYDNFYITSIYTELIFNALKH
jgi:D-alanine-D-alanine ligase